MHTEIITDRLENIAAGMRARGIHARGADLAAIEAERTPEQRAAYEERIAPLRARALAAEAHVATLASIGIVPGMSAEQIRAAFDAAGRPQMSEADREYFRLAGLDETDIASPSTATDAPPPERDWNRLAGLTADDVAKFGGAK